MRSLKNKPQVNAPSSTYPHGQIRDDDGSGNVGTPVNEQVYGDFHQFFSQLMADAALASNELPENEYNGFQLNTALGLFINRLIRASVPVVYDKVINIGDWNMDTTALVSIAHGLNYAKIVSVDVIIIADVGSGIDTYPLNWNDGGGAAGTGGFYSWDASNLKLSRVATGIFDDSNHDATSFNRGFITIHYLP